MEPYCFIFRVKPEPGAIKPQPIIGEKFAMVFALFETEKEAERQSIKILVKNHWDVTAKKSVSSLVPLQIVNFDTRQKDCYKNATRNRISYCILEDWPDFLNQTKYK